MTALKCKLFGLFLIGLLGHVTALGQVIREPIALENRPTYVFEKNGKYGVKERGTDKVLKRAVYDSLGLYLSDQSELGIAYKKKGWAVVDREGQALTKFRFKRIRPMGISNPSPYLKASLDGLRWGLIGPDGKLLSAQFYDEIQTRPHRHFQVRKGDDVGILDSLGIEVIPLAYRRLDYLAENAYRTHTEAGVGVAFTDGSQNIPAIYQSAKTVRNGFVLEQNKRYFLYNARGQREEVGPFDEAVPYGNYFHNVEVLVRQDGLYGLYSIGRGWVLPPIYAGIQRSGDYHLVTFGGKKGVYRKDGSLELAPIYDAFQRTTHGYVVRLSDKMGIVDSNQNTLLPIVYDSIVRLIRPRGGGLDYAHALLLNGEWSMANSSGQVQDIGRIESFTTVNTSIALVERAATFYVLDYANDSLHLYTNFPLQNCGELNLWLSIYSFQQKGVYGVIDLNFPFRDLPGRVLLEAQYETMRFDPNNNHLIVSKQGKLGLISRAGVEILACKYDSIEPAPYTGPQSKNALIAQSAEQKLMVWSNGRVEEL